MNQEPISDYPYWRDDVKATGPAMNKPNQEQAGERWTYDESTDCVIIPGITRKGQIYDDVEVYCGDFADGGMDLPEAKIRGRMVAAAPETKAQRDELLVALRKAEELLAVVAPNYDALADVRAAIANAERSA